MVGSRLILLSQFKIGREGLILIKTIVGFMFSLDTQKKYVVTSLSLVSEWNKRKW